jgi:hypothetical protein
LFALASGVAAPIGLAAPVQASTPPTAWQQLKALHVLCLIASNKAGERQTLEEALCGRVQALAAPGAPVPVTKLPFGDPAAIDPARATLLVHGRVQQMGKNRLLIVNIRPYRTGGTGREMLFSAPPVAVPLGASAPSDAALDEALAPVLADLLPWRAQAAGPRPIQ